MALEWVVRPCGRPSAPAHALEVSLKSLPCFGRRDKKENKHPTKPQTSGFLQSLNCKESHLGRYCDWVSSSQCQHGLSLRPGWKEASREGWGRRKQAVKWERGQVQAWTESMGRVGKMRAEMWIRPLNMLSMYSVPSPVLECTHMITFTV